MQQLTFLRTGEDRSLKLVQAVGIKWKDLGIALEFDYGVIETIERDTHFQNNDSCCKLLHKWLSGEACQPVTWRRLIQALHEAEHGTLAMKLEEFLTNS